MINKRNLIIAAAVVAAVLVAGLLFWALRQQSQLNEMVEQLEFEKEALQDEYEDLAIQFDGYQQLDVRNDSLQDLLYREQQRVKDLLEELRITKVTHARRIAELKKELATVRQVMVGYVQQIDSLNRTNARLTEENKQYREQNTRIVAENTQLAETNTQLQQTVSRAAMLEMTDFRLITLNRHDRKTTLFSKIQKLEFRYSIGKNITCEPGLKYVYLRIIRPDGEVMTKSEDNVFEFENSRIEYSVRQEIEYTGEEMSSVMYWPVEEILYSGVYNADFFVDGNQIGSFPFSLKK
ncbi:MAG: hypothetical protein IJP52_03180 [Paludibacteraceae bacterium]|nr:hypothetical protein [Paludibacteraceae bacterium]